MIQIRIFFISLFIGLVLVCGCVQSPILSKSYNSTDFKFQIQYPDEFKVTEYETGVYFKSDKQYFESEKQFFQMERVPQRSSFPPEGFIFRIDVYRNCNYPDLTWENYDVFQTHGEIDISDSNVDGYPSKRITKKMVTDVVGVINVKITEDLIKNGTCYRIQGDSEEPFDYQMYNNMVRSIKFT
jgi:hypothetical protein